MCIRDSIEGEALKVRDFSPYETLSLWVKNPGPDDAELSLSIADQSGQRAFSNPPSVTIKPGRWEQILSRFTDVYKRQVLPSPTSSASSTRGASREATSAAIDN